MYQSSSIIAKWDIKQNIKKKIGGKSLHDGSSRAIILTIEGEIEVALTENIRRFELSGIYFSSLCT